jgi:uncharacterized membrane protein YdjX (TVP38/TMEM64 family)
MKRRTRIFLGLGLLLAIAAMARFFPLADWVLSFIRWVRSLGLLGVAVYAAVYVIGTVSLVSGTALTLGAGFLYGPVFGTLLVSPASVAGATISFVLARHFARGWVEKRIAKYPRFSAIDRAVGRQGFKMVLLMRLDPIFLPFAVLNYALGLTSVKLRDYVVSSWIGMLPASILYVYVGSLAANAADLLRHGTESAGYWSKILFWAGLAASGILVALLTRIAGRALRRELQEEEEEPGPVRAGERIG